MTQQKRQRESQRRERAERKAARRAERASTPRPDVAPGEDPQLAGLVVGPRPPVDDDDRDEADHA